MAGFIGWTFFYCLKKKNQLGNVQTQKKESKEAPNKAMKLNTILNVDTCRVV